MSRYVSAPVIERVFEAEAEGGSGTGFAINIGGQEYLVTAAHLFQAGDVRPSVRVRSAFVDQMLDLELLAVARGADVAVAPLSVAITPPLDLPASRDGWFFSQQAFFLGYPFGMALHSAELGRKPFIKGALLSASEVVQGVEILYLDGLNNPGFSGGPVVPTSTTRSA